MTTKTTRCASALLLAACLMSAAFAQTNARYTYCGNSNLDLEGLNGARTTAMPGTAPGLQQELWCEGDFLGYGGRYYTVLAEAYASTYNFGGIGKWEMRVGRSTVRSSYASVLTYRQKSAVNQDLLKNGTSKDLNFGFMSARLNGSLALDLDVNLDYFFGVSQARTNGAISGHATGSLSASVIAPSIWRVTQSHNIDLGRQEFRGKAEVLRRADNSELAYSMSLMRVYLNLCFHLGSTSFGCSQLVWSIRSAVNVASFM